MVLNMSLCEEALVAKVPLLVARCRHPRARLVEKMHEELSARAGGAGLSSARAGASATSAAEASTWRM
jgi:hypothetical protein